MLQGIAENTYLQAIMDTVLDGLVTIDSRGTILSFNSAAQRIFGYLPDEVIGRNITVLMPEPYRSEHDQYLENYHSTGIAKIIGIGREVAARRKDGSVFPMELGVNKMVIDGQMMFVGTIRDISERKQAAEAINEFVEKLKRSNQELDDFAYIASHDLKEPIRGLSNNAQFLKEDFADILGRDGIRRLDRMSFLCQRMEKLIDDLLYYSRLGRQELAVKEVNLNTVIEDVQVLLQSMLNDQNVAIVIPISLPAVICDVPRITELFRNLISNGIKYNRQDRKILEIGVTATAESARTFYVRDNGIGIEPEFHNEVFRIFKRLNAEDDTMKGTGVGLTFVQKIVERHGGRIWLDSQPGEGTTFYFTLNLEGVGRNG